MLIPCCWCCSHKFIMNAHHHNERQCCIQLQQEHDHALCGGGNNMCRWLHTTNGKTATKRTNDSRYSIPISDMKLPNVVAAHGLEKLALFIQPLTRCLYFRTTGVPEIYKSKGLEGSNVYSFLFFLSFFL